MIYGDSYFKSFEDKNLEHEIKAEIYFVDEARVDAEQVKDFFQRLFDFCRRGGWR